MNFIIDSRRTVKTSRFVDMDTNISTSFFAFGAVLILKLANAPRLDPFKTILQKRINVSYFVHLRLPKPYGSGLKSPRYLK
jgi:hypothetical protein